MSGGTPLSQLTLPLTEAAIAGAIAFNPQFYRLSEDALITPKAFAERHWQIIYRAALTLRKEGETVNAQTINEYIASHRLDAEFQEALDSSKITDWRNWPDKATADFFICGVSHLEDALGELTRFYVKREEIEIGERLASREISSADAIALLQNLPKRGARVDLFVNLKQIIEGGLKPERPSVAMTPTGKCLLYAGRLNEIHGEPSVGKTKVALSLARCVIEDGGHVIYIDPEDTPAGILNRLAATGADVEALEPFIHYLHNPMPADFSRAIAYAEKHKPALVVLDGLAEALAAEGKDENEVGDVLTFFRERLRPFAEAGAAVLIADHVTKSTETRGKWARGSGAKLGRYDGVSYSAELIEAYSPKSRARYGFACRKTETAAWERRAKSQWSCILPPASTA